MRAAWLLPVLLAGCSGSGTAPSDKPSEGQVLFARAELAAAEAQVAFAEAEVALQEAQDLAAMGRLKEELAQAERRLAQSDADADRQAGELALEVTRAEDGIEDARDELDQLRKMYQGNDLADQTKEIVLKRGERALKRARVDANLKARKLKAFRELALPLEHDRLALEAASKRMELENEAKKAALLQKRSGLLQARAAVDKARLALEELLAKQGR